MYNLPQEIEVWYVIPAVRREFAKVFTKKYKLTQEEAAEILGVSKAAVSQYINSKRASLKLPKEIVNEIEKSAGRVIKDRGIVVGEIMRIISLVKNRKLLCNLCKKYNKGILKICAMDPIRG
jgi:predicted transcriptional regulator